MGMIQKKDEQGHELIDGIEIIESGDVPGEEHVATINLVAGTSAEDIAEEGRRARGEDDVPDDEKPLTPFGADDDDAPASVESEAADDSAKEDGSASDADAAGSMDASAVEDSAEDVEGDTSTEAPVQKAPARSAAPKPDKADGAASQEEASDEPHKSASQQGMKPALVVVIVVVAVIVAAIAGYVVGSGSFGAATGLTSATLTEDQLDTPVASYTYNGKTVQVTAREAIESQYSLETVQNDDGTYPAPSASNTLTYVRNQILLADAESRGIEVSDDEMTSYAEEHLGTSDFETISEQYGVTEDQAREIVRENALIIKLRNQVVPEADVSAPEMPSEPADDNAEAVTKEYADYIIALAGDAWDAETGTWASEDNAYAQAFSGQTITADGATYNQAITAYYVAYQDYSSALNDASAAWTDYANTLFVNAKLTLLGVFA